MTGHEPMLPAGVSGAEPLSPKLRRALVEIVYWARRERLLNPHGQFDGGRRWHPDEDYEGGTPDVRFPSRAWPWSYMTACRTRKWVARLPWETLLAEARAVAGMIREGRAAEDRGPVGVMSMNRRVITQRLNAVRRLVRILDGSYPSPVN